MARSKLQTIVNTLDDIYQVLDEQYEESLARGEDCVQDVAILEMMQAIILLSGLTPEER